VSIQNVKRKYSVLWLSVKFTERKFQPSFPFARDTTKTNSKHVHVITQDGLRNHLQPFDTSVCAISYSHVPISIWKCVKTSAVNGKSCYIKCLNWNNKYTGFRPWYFLRTTCVFGASAHTCV
jgi:hypothetical protein